MARYAVKIIRIVCHVVNIRCGKPLLEIRAVGNVEGGLAHAKHIENRLLGKLAHAAVGKDLHKSAENVKTEAVSPAVAGLKAKRHGGKGLQHVACRTAAVFGGNQILDLLGFHIVAKPRRHGENVNEADLTLGLTA